MKTTAPYLVNHGLAQQALRVLAASPNGEAKFIGFRAITFVQAHTGEIAGASQTLAEMSREANNLNQTGMSREVASGPQRETELAMRTVAIALAESGNVGQAMDIALRIQDSSLRVEALLPIGAAQSRAGDRQSAAKTFKQAEETIRGLLDKSSQVLAIVQLAKAQARGKDTQAAFNTAETLHQVNSSFAPFYTNALKQISLEQARFGDSGGAVQTAERIDTIDEKLPALNVIASVQLERGDRSGALVTCQEELRLISGKSESAEVASQFPKIALVQSNAGDRADADKSLERALTMSLAVKDPEKQFSLFADVAEAQAQLGDIEAAKLTNSRVPPQYWAEKKRIIKSIADAEAQSNRPYEALATMWSVECPQGNQRRRCLEEYATTLAGVTRLLAKNGNEKMAFAWAQISSPPAAKAKSFLEIANGLLDQISSPVSISEMSTVGWDSY